MRIKSLLAALAKVPNFIRPFNINQRFGLLCVRVSVDKVFLRAEVYRPRVPLPLWSYAAFSFNFFRLLSQLSFFF